MSKVDNLQRFIFSDAHVRGEVVQLDNSLAEMLANASYPQTIKGLLSEMASAAVLLSATLKFEGEISLQIQGKGPVNYAVVDATHASTFRGIARWDEQAELPTAFEKLCADSVLVITISPAEGERYQGVVALDKPSLAECIENYFTQSEQLPTRVYLFQATDEQIQAGGFLLQVLPKSSEASTEADTHEFEHFATLANTLTAKELFELPVSEVLHRLYHEHNIQLFDAKTVKFACTCSKERSAVALQNIAKAELLEIVQQEGCVSMNCQYCHAEYRFDAIDIEAIHNGDPVNSVPRNTH